MDAVKAYRERVRRHGRREINGDKDSIVGMIVLVPRGLVSMPIEPFTYLGQRCRKLSGAYPNRDAAHDPLTRSFCRSQHTFITG
jgi:hypothetical protein